MKMTDQQWSGVRLAIRQLTYVVAHNKELRGVTQFVDGNLTVALTRRHRYTARARSEEFVLTFGRPNYAARMAVKRDPNVFRIFRQWPAKKKGAK